MQDPVHVLVETTLLLSVLYMLISQRNRDWRQDKNERLQKEEEKALLRQWKQEERVELAPTDIDYGVPQVIVHAVHGRTMDIQQGDDNGQVHTVLNFATNDFLGMSSSTLENDQDGPGVAVKNASREALSKYGCGSCGPRGFYGTIDVHLDLEEAISKFTKTEGAIMYSDGASTVSSTIAAFAKRGDLLVVDDGVYEPILTGVSLSRANVKWFRHNDMDDLRRVLNEIKATDVRLGRKSSDQRRFIVVEGLYKNSGTIVPLAELVALKHEYFYRLIIDESFSFGTLGDTGRGVIEMSGKRYMYDADIVTISLENALGSIGGVTVGNEEVVDHQRLSGAGYCFSASCPPFTASAAIQALSQLESRPELLRRLNEIRVYFHKRLSAEMNGVVPQVLVVTSDEKSPIVFLEVSENAEAVLKDKSLPDDASLLEAVVQECLQNGVAMVSTARHAQDESMGNELPLPAIKLTLSTVHTKKDIDECLSTLRMAVQNVFCL